MNKGCFVYIDNLSCLENKNTCISFFILKVLMQCKIQKDFNAHDTASRIIILDRMDIYWNMYMIV